MDDFDWNDLQSFLAIAETGTLSAAAQRLGVTQPTMGRRLKSMESRLGLRLLEATPDGFVPTAAGEAILADVENARDALTAARRKISGQDLRLEGTVRVTTVEILASEVVIPAVAALCAAHQGITVELLPDNRSLSLSRREADLALRVPRFEGNQLFARKVGAIDHALYVAESRARETGLPIVTVLEDQEHLPQIDWFHRQIADAPIAFRSNDRELQALAVARGIGIGLLPMLVGEKTPGLRRIDTLGRPPSRDIWLGVHRDMRHMPRIRVTIDAIVEACAALPSYAV